jgi:hypothetical protein
LRFVSSCQNEGCTSEENDANCTTGIVSSTRLMDVGGEGDRRQGPEFGK